MTEEMAEGLTIEEAIRVLEITDFAGLTLEDLPNLRKKAMRRWHPDRIAHAGPDAALVAEYQANFVKVEPAIAMLRRVLSGEEDVAPHRQGSNQREPTPEEAVTKYAASNQERLRRAWADIRGKAEFYSEEDVVLAEGITVAEALRADLDDKMPATAVFSFATGQAFLVMALLGLLIPFVILEVLGMDGVISFIVSLVFIAWIAHAISCLVVLAPLSRLWMPAEAMQFAARIVDAPIRWSDEWEEGFWVTIFKLVLHLVSLAVENLVVRPIYYIAGQIWADKRLFRAVTTLRYYAGLSETYVDRLVQMDTSAMDLEELYDLSHAASRLGAN